MTGTWDPILLLLPPVLRPCRFARHPLLLPASPSLSSPDSHPLTRLDSSLVSLLSSSFPSPVDRSATAYLPTYLPTITFSTSLFPSASLSTHAYLSTGALSSLEALFLLGDKCKTKTYSPLLYSLCKYAGIAASMARVFSSFVSYRLSLPVAASSAFAILFMIICIQHSANRYREVLRGCNWNDGLFYFSARDC